MNKKSLLQKRSAGSFPGEGLNKRIVDTSSIGILTYRISGECFYANEAAAKITGTTVDKLLTENFHDIESWKNSRMYDAAMKAIATASEQRMETHVTTTLEEDVWLSLNFSSFKDGGENYLLVFMQDITGRKQVEVKLERAAQEWRRTFDSIADLISIHDENCRLLRVNMAYANALKMKPQELIGRYCFELLHHANQPVQNCPHLETLKTGKPAKIEMFEPTLGACVEITTSPIFGNKGEVIASVHIIRDITERKRVAQLEIDAEAANLASQTKSEFLASMSHELRTPLNAILGFSQVLQEQYFGKLNEKQAEYITDILESGRHLISLINDILDLSKIESGKEYLELSSIKIKDLVESSLFMIRERVSKHGINLSLLATADVDGLEIRADVRKVKQIIFNLLANAAKFTPDGGSITVEVKRAAEAVIVSITDTGIGVAPENKERIWERFFQVGKGSINKTPGTGLGLTLSKHLVEMHGGEIHVESEGLEKGSRFSFSLPIQGKGEAEEGTEV